MIIDFNSTPRDISAANINLLIADTIKHTEMLELQLEELPATIAGYSTLRAILRFTKRSGDLDEAVDRYSFEACPPQKNNTTCGTISCSECWKNFCGNYTEEVLNGKK